MKNLEEIKIATEHALTKSLLNENIDDEENAIHDALWRLYKYDQAKSDDCDYFLKATDTERLKYILEVVLPEIQP